MLYQLEITGEPMEKVVESFWRVRNATDSIRSRAEHLARGTREHIAQIDTLIAETAVHWPFDRIASVDRNILRLGTFELMWEPATPPAVVLDEAVEMAKRFGEIDSSAFVNGVLDAIWRRVRTEEGGGVGGA